MISGLSDRIPRARTEIQKNRSIRHMRQQQYVADPHTARHGGTVPFFKLHPQKSGECEPATARTARAGRAPAQGPRTENPRTKSTLPSEIASHRQSPKVVASERPSWAVRSQAFAHAFRLPIFPSLRPARRCQKQPPETGTWLRQWSPCDNSMSRFISIRGHVSNRCIWSVRVQEHLEHVELCKPS